MIASMSRLLGRIGKRTVITVILGLAVGLAAVAAFLQSPASEQRTASTMRSAAAVRISPAQYVQSIKDIFGASLEFGATSELPVRDNGLLALGAVNASFTETGLERLESTAQAIASQVVDVRRRAVLIPCKPASASAPDDACVREFVSRSGFMLYRRPMAEEEIAAQVQVARASTEILNDFYAGLAQSLAAMLISPNFLFVHRFVEPVPGQPQRYRLDAFSKAAQLSFFFWNTTPDRELLAAAEGGGLHTKEGLRRQVDRLVNSPRLETGLRAFFTDMLEFEAFHTLTKDANFFPRFTRSAKLDAEEQTLRTIVDLLITQDGDYRDLFTTRKTFLTRSLAALYGVPLVDKSDNGEPARWLPYEFPADSPRVGVLGHASFLALHSHAGRSSPTLRGKALREVFLCQKVPPPPGDVDFSLVDGLDGSLKTARQRLEAHTKVAACAGCHKITDPIGLTLENFDSASGFRTLENGSSIDTKGDFNGMEFSTPLGLAQAIHADVAASSCVAQRLFAFGAHRMPPMRDPRWLEVMQEFEKSGYRIRDLMRRIATSEAFFDAAAIELPQDSQTVSTGKQIASSSIAAR